MKVFYLCPLSQLRDYFEILQKLFQAFVLLNAWPELPQSLADVSAAGSLLTD